MYLYVDLLSHCQLHPYKTYDTYPKIKLLFFVQIIHLKNNYHPRKRNDSDIFGFIYAGLGNVQL